VALYFMSVPALLAQRKRDPKYTYGTLAFISLLFSFGTISNGIALFMNQLAFIDFRNYPGGPAIFASSPVPQTEKLNIAATAFYFFNQWLQDGFLVYLSSLSFLDEEVTQFLPSSTDSSS
jgi:hypothetical protein